MATSKRGARNRHELGGGLRADLRCDGLEVAEARLNGKWLVFLVGMTGFEPATPTAECVQAAGFAGGNSNL
jgi:hypothetical protein